MSTEFSAIPGYNRALERGRRLETAWREFALLGANTRICGVEVRLITLRMFLQLDNARSPFISGGRIRPADVAIFLWRLSPAYDAAVQARKDHEAAGPSRENRRRQLERFLPAFLARRFLPNEGCPFAAGRARFAASIAHLPFGRAARAIMRYLDCMLMDKPPSRIPANGAKQSISDVSFAADLIHAMGGNAYREQTLDTPLPVLFQMVRQIQRDHQAEAGKRLPPFNPLQSRLTKRFRARARAAAEAAASAAAMNGASE